MRNFQTQHRVSDELKHRHPYYPHRLDNAQAFAKDLQPDHVSVAYGNRGVPKLLGLIKNESLPLDKLGATLQHLNELLKHPEQRSCAIDGGVLPLCEALLVRSEDEIRVGALKVVRAVSCMRKACERAEFEACVENVLLNLTHESSVVREEAMAVLCTVTQQFKGRNVVFAINEAILHIAKALPDAQSHHANMHGLITLTNLTKEACGVKPALDSGCICIAAELLETEKTDLYPYAAELVCNLGVPQSGKSQAVEAGLVALLADKLAPTYERMTQRFASSALVALSNVKEGKEALGEEAVATRLCNAIEDPDRIVRRNCMAVIKSASESQRSRQVYIRGLLTNEKDLFHIFGSSSADTILYVLGTADAATKESCLKCLAAMITENEGIKSIYSCIYSVEKLGSILASDSPGLRDRSLYLLEVMSKANSSVGMRLSNYLDKLSLSDSLAAEIQQSVAEFVSS